MHCIAHILLYTHTHITHTRTRARMQSLYTHVRLPSYSPPSLWLPLPLHVASTSTSSLYPPSLYPHSLYPPSIITSIPLPSLPPAVKCVDRAMVSFPPPIPALELLSYRDQMPVEALDWSGSPVVPVEWATLPATSISRVRIDRPPLGNFSTTHNRAAGHQKAAGGDRLREEEGGSASDVAQGATAVDMD